MLAMQARLEAVHHLVRAHDTAEALHEPLTGRELDVLRLLPSALSIQEIAAELYLTGNTVKTHARSIYRKLGAHSRADAVLVARSRSLL
jgi:LuxR family maltose regulon positive regulatory protein